MRDFDYPIDSDIFDDDMDIVDFDDDDDDGDDEHNVRSKPIKRSKDAVRREIEAWHENKMYQNDFSNDDDDNYYDRDIDYDFNS